MKWFAGIGSRATPPNVCARLAIECKKLAKLGYGLRSGGADGADMACELGCILGLGEKEIYLPWKGFNKNTSELFHVSKEARKIASEFHPAWDRLSNGAMCLMGRNVYQMLGQTLDSPVEFVLCWTTDGEASGGTGQALRIAEHYEIPVYNLFKVADEELPWNKV